jgi:uncharacterized protein YbaR (Trm112 family)
VSAILFCPECKKQVEVTRTRSITPRMGGHMKVNEYRCPEGHVFEKVSGRWRGTSARSANRRKRRRPA